MEKWNHHMRKCPCGGVVDDDLSPPLCCECGKELPDLDDGPQALPAPAGYVFQKDVPDFVGVKAPAHLNNSLMDALRRRME